MYKIIVSKHGFENQHPWVTYTDEEILAALGVVPEEYELDSVECDVPSSVLIFWVRDKDE